MSLRTLYKIARYKNQIGEKASSSRAKSLTEELAILRLTLETLMNGIEDDSQLIAQSQNISDIIDKIAKLATGAQRLDMATGETLDKTQLAAFADHLTLLVSKTDMPDDSRIKLQTGITDLATKLFSVGLTDGVKDTKVIEDVDLQARMKALDLEDEEDVNQSRNDAGSSTGV